MEGVVVSGAAGSQNGRVVEQETDKTLRRGSPELRPALAHVLGVNDLKYLARGHLVSSESTMAVC
jgi:hypothetical protein